MATVIDSLVVELGLDPAKFSAGLKQTMTDLAKAKSGAQDTAKEMQFQGGKASEFFSMLTTKALGFAAVFMGGMGLKQFAEHMTESDAAVSRFGRAFSQSGAAVNKWIQMARLAGGTSEDVTQSFGQFADAIQAWQHGLGDPMLQNLISKLQQAGGAVIPLKGSIDEVFTAISDDLRKVAERSPAEANWFARQMGLTPGMVNLLLQDVRKIAAEVPGLPTKESLENSEKLLAAWRGINLEVENLGRSLLANVNPALLEMAHFVTNVFDGIGKVVGWLNKLNAIHTPAAPTEEEKKVDEFLNKPLVTIDPKSIMKRLEDWGIFAPGTTEEMFKPEAPAPGAPGTASPGSAIPSPPTAAPFTPRPLAPAGTSALTGEQLVTVTTNNGKRVTVAASAATDFLGFLNALEAAGAPVTSLGGYANRTIFGTNYPSEHAKGRAVDVSAVGASGSKNIPDPAFMRWLVDHRAQYDELLRQFHMRGGETFSSGPDVGHVEWRPLPGQTPTVAPVIPRIEPRPPGPASSTAPEPAERISALPSIEVRPSIFAPVTAEIPNIDVGSSAGASSTTNDNRVSRTTTSETHIGQINVNTPATDAAGIVRDIKPEIQRANFALLADYGMA